MASRASRLRHRRRAASEEGFSIAEVVLAISLLLVVLLASSRLFATGIQVSGDTRLRVVATNLATQAIEQARGAASDPTKFTTGITIGQTTTTQLVNKVTYTVTQNAEWVGQRAEASNCDAGGNDVQILRVTASVTWPRMRGTKPVQSTTTLAPPVGAYSPLSGAIAAKLLRADTTLVAGVTVTAVGTTSRSIVTGSDGCAFFAFLPPGTYTVSVSSPGWVGDQEQSTPTQSTSVTVGTTKALTFSYDQAATISLTGFSGTAAAATNLPVSVANTGLQPYGQAVFAAGTTSMTPLFPYRDGYSLFAGSCTDANPLGLAINRSPFYPSADTDPVEVVPGATTTGAVPVFALALSVKNTSGVVQVGATATATATAPPVPGGIWVCPNGTPTYGLAATGTTGLSTTGVSLGHLTVNVTAGSKQGTVKVWVQPGGVYAVNSSGTATTLYSGAVPVVVN